MTDQTPTASGPPLRERLRQHIAFMRRQWPNEPEIADDMELAAALLDAEARAQETTDQDPESSR